MPKIRFHHTYNNIISLENLLEAWKEFVRGKRVRKDVQEFERDLMTNLIALHRELAAGTYRHGDYSVFTISDPKRRIIHKAPVRDRLLHHAVHRVFYPYFDLLFIADSYSCRVLKGTHAALNRFRRFVLSVSKNNTQQCWVLQCDIKKFFASINHRILIRILERKLDNTDVLWLLQEIIESFHTSNGRGLPLGNLTSQLFANIYMNEFDRFVKHRLRAKHYIRYADDFVIFSNDKQLLHNLIPQITAFLRDILHLKLHQDKVLIRTIGSGVDFLGWAHFPDHRVLRGTTRRRMMNRIVNNPAQSTIQSYLGLLQHGNAIKLTQEILELTRTLPIRF